MEIGICTFADVGTHPLTKESIAPFQRLKNLLEEMELADQLGLDVFAVGEHHRPDYAVSSPAVILAAAAVRTKNIKLSSGVTVLSSDDPVRVFQDFATVDLLSGGRAEIMAGRGSFIESFPLFGYNLNDYNELFSEKLEMLVKLTESERITWKGTHTQSIANLGVYPRPFQQRLPVWVAVGGTPESVVRAAERGLPMALAIIGGMLARFAPLAQLYRTTYEAAGHDVDAMQLCINSHTYVAETSQRAGDEFFPPYAEVMSRIGRERGWPPLSRAGFDASAGPQGALLVGSPQQVIDKILYEHSLFGHTRFLAQLSIGALPHKEAMRAIELLGGEVAPAVRKYTAAKKGEAVM
ncbi:MAG TPA: LLM class flavin-dependent oxidoreductase [Flavisolibacter sp.]